MTTSPARRRAAARCTLAVVGAAGLAWGGWAVLADRVLAVDDSCLAGTWLVDPDSVRATVTQAVEAGEMRDLAWDVTVEGDMLRTFDGGRYAEVYVGQEVSMTADLGHVRSGSVATVDGELSGEYRIVGDRIEVTGLDADKLDQPLATTVNGERFDLGDVGRLAMTAGTSDKLFEFRCAGDTLVLTPVVDGHAVSAAAVWHSRR